MKPKTLVLLLNFVVHFVFFFFFSFLCWIPPQRPRTPVQPPALPSVAAAVDIIVLSLFNVFVRRMRCKRERRRCPRRNNTTKRTNETEHVECFGRCWLLAAVKHRMTSKVSYKERLFSFHSFFCSPRDEEGEKEKRNETYTLRTHNGRNL